MALSKVKTEMKGTGGGRFTTREDAKVSAKKRRRRIDRKAALLVLALVGCGSTAKPAPRSTVREDLAAMRSVDMGRTETAVDVARSLIDDLATDAGDDR